MKKWLFLLLFLVSSQVFANKNIIVTIKPLFGLIQTLGEGVFEPILLCESASSPHTHSLTPLEIKKLKQADFVIWIGPSYESIMSKVIEKFIPLKNRLALEHTQNITLLKPRTGELFPTSSCSHTCEHHDHHHSIDGHFWLDPLNMKMCLQEVALKLIELFPNEKEKINKNLSHLLIELDVLDQELKNIFSQIKNVTFIAYHDAFAYLDARYGLTTKGAFVQEPGMPLLPQHVLNIKKFLKNTQKKALLCEDTYDVQLLSKLSLEYNCPLIKVDYVGSTQPLQKNIYQQTLLMLAHAIKNGVEKL